MLTGWGKTAVYRHLWQGRRRPRWTDDDNQVLVDGYADLPRGKIGHILAEKLGRSSRAIYIAMCRYRKKVRADPKKKRALSAISFALRAVRRADIFREVTE